MNISMNMVKPDPDPKEVALNAVLGANAPQPTAITSMINFATTAAIQTGVFSDNAQQKTAKTVTGYYEATDILILRDALLKKNRQRVNADNLVVPENGVLGNVRTFVTPPFGCNESADGLKETICLALLEEATTDKQILFPYRLQNVQHWVTGCITIKNNANIQFCIHDSARLYDKEPIERELEEFFRMPEKLDSFLSNPNRIKKCSDNTQKLKTLFFKDGIPLPFNFVGRSNIFPIQLDVNGRLRNTYCGGYTIRLIVSLALDHNKNITEKLVWDCNNHEDKTLREEDAETVKKWNTDQINNFASIAEALDYKSNKEHKESERKQREEAAKLILKAEKEIKQLPTATLRKLCSMMLNCDLTDNKLIREKLVEIYYKQRSLLLKCNPLSCFFTNTPGVIENGTSINNRLIIKTFYKNFLDILKMELRKRSEPRLKNIASNSKHAKKKAKIFSQKAHRLKRKKGIGKEKNEKIIEQTQKENKVFKLDSKTEKADQDKILDIKALFELYLKIEGFIKETKKFFQVKQPKKEDINNLILELSKTCCNIRWNVKNAQYIRNLYGKINYKSGRKNPNFIDFERIAFLDRYPDEKVKDQIVQVVQLNFPEFLNEFSILCNNILFILKTEYFENKHNNQIKIEADGKDIKASLSIIDFRKVTMTNINLLTNLISFYYDGIFIEKICQSESLESLKSINPKSEETRWLYSFARVLTLIGESSKNLSDHFKEQYLFLPLHVISKMRDQLGHVHHKHIKNPSPAIMGAYARVVETDFPNLQIFLRGLKNSFNPLLDLRNVLPFVKKQFANTPAHLQELARSHVDATKNDAESSSLRSLRIKYLIQRKESFSIEKNDIEQKKKEKSAVSSSDNPDVKRKRTQTKIDELIQKKERSLAEEKALESAKKQLKKLERNKITHPNKAPSNSKKLNKSSGIKSELDSIEKELKSLRMFSSFEEILSMMLGSSNTALDPKTAASKKTSKEKKITQEQRLGYITKDLKSEIDTLQGLFKSKKKDGRDYAIEYCMATIGQLMRDLEDNKSALLKEIQSINLTVKRGFEETVKTRNQKIMHDPFSDNSLELLRVLSNITLPLSLDIKAIETIHGATDLNKINEGTIYKILSTFYKIGSAYMRLELWEKAEYYYLQALETASPINYAKFHINNMGFPLENDKVPTIEMLDPTAYCVTQGNFLYAFCGEEPIWVTNKIVILYNLGMSLLKQQNKNKEARQYLEKALELLPSSDIHDHKYKLSLMANLIVAIYHTDTSTIDSIHKEKSRYFNVEDRYDYYAYICMHYADIKSKLNKSKEGLVELLKVDEKKIKDWEIIIEYYLQLGILCENVAQQHDDESALISSNIISGNSLIYRRKAISFLETDLKLYEKHEARLISLRGDSIRKAKENCALCLGKMMGSLAAKWRPMEAEESYNLIKRSIFLQKKYQHPVQISYSTLGSICETLYIKTKNTNYLHEGLDAYDCAYALSQTDREKAISLAGKAAAFIDLDKPISEKIMVLVEAIFYYSKVNDSNRDEYDRTDEEFLCENLISLKSKHSSEFIAVVKAIEHSDDAKAKLRIIKELQVIYERAAAARKTREQEEASKKREIEARAMARKVRDQVNPLETDSENKMNQEMAADVLRLCKVASEGNEAEALFHLKVLVSAFKTKYKEKANINLYCNKATIMHRVAKKGRIEILLYLEGQGGSMTLTTQTENKCTVMQYLEENQDKLAAYKSRKAELEKPPIHNLSYLP